MSHTPGPWDYFVGNANGRGLIRIEQQGTGVHIASMPRGAISEANARLIAAAPEYDYAAQCLVERAAEIEACLCGDTLDEFRICVALAKAAIAKAIG